jgi:cellobiose phosphorylase
VYSSGPGIYIGLIITKLLGLRVESGNIILDPVIPFSFDGLSVTMNFMNRSLRFKYEVKEGNYSPRSISINGKPIQFGYEENKYRKGGAVIPAGQFVAMLNQEENSVEIIL